MQLLCCQNFIKSQVKKRKIFIRVFSKQHDFTSQDFLVVGSNGWEFMWGDGTPPAGRGGGVSMCVTAHALVPDSTRRPNQIRDAVLFSNPIPFSFISKTHFQCSFCKG